MKTSDSVAEILVKEGGYRLLPKPLCIGSQSFDFTHALVAETRANDLVIVVELNGGSADDAIVRKILALTRALDVLRSTRPVTVVLTSGQPGQRVIQSIGKVCRILPVGNPLGDKARDAVRDWLAVLLPLVEPSVVDMTLDWEAELRRTVNEGALGDLMEGLIASAVHGEDAVNSTFANNVANAVSAASEE